MGILSVPITKGKGVIDIDTDALPDDVFAEAMLQGLKVLLNRGASKITKEAYPNEEEMKAAAMAKANEQLELVKTSKIKFSGKAKASKASGAVMTEARRLARNLIKDELKAAKIKISTVDAKEITKAANDLLAGAQGEALIAKAKENLEARANVSVSADLISAIKVNPKKVQALEAKKAEAKANKPLSATQAGKTAPRAKGQKGSAAPQASA